MNTVIEFQETANINHRIILDGKLSDKEFDEIMSQVDAARCKDFGDVKYVFYENINKKIIGVNEEYSYDIDNIEYYDDYIEE